MKGGPATDQLDPTGIEWISLGCSNAETKKAGVAEHPMVFDHAGLLFNEPSSHAEMLFAKSSDTYIVRVAIDKASGFRFLFRAW